jgi:hypothetical protein
LGGGRSLEDVGASGKIRGEGGSEPRRILLVFRGMKIEEMQDCKQWS